MNTFCKTPFPPFLAEIGGVHVGWFQGDNNEEDETDAEDAEEDEEEDEEEIDDVDEEQTTLGWCFFLFSNWFVDFYGAR